MTDPSGTTPARRGPASIEDLGLTSRQAQCLALHRIDGLSCQQIGRLAGISHQMVSRHIRAARGKLLKLIPPPPSQPFEAKLKTVSPFGMDRLGPADIKAVW